MTYNSIWWENGAENDLSWCNAPTFYGKQSLDGRPSQEQYHQALINHHIATRTPSNSAQFVIGLEFDHVINGEKSTFYVERSWK